MINWRKFIVTGALATTLTFSSLSASAVSFNDVSSNEQSITKLVSLGLIVNGSSNFNPDKGLSRQEFAEITSRIMSLGAPKAIKMKDVKNNTAVAKAVTAGILSINTKGEFKPKNAITYADLARGLAFGLGFKKTWSNRSIDHLYFLERKGVLDLDTDLDSAVTREDAAVAIDKFMQVSNGYITGTGIVDRINAGVVIIKTDIGNMSFKVNTKASLFVEEQAAGLTNIPKGTEVNLVLNKRGEIAYLSGAGQDLLDGAFSYKNGDLMFGSTAKAFKLNAVVASLPNASTVPFTFNEFSNYSAKAGVSFAGTLYANSVTDEITMMEPYITKVADRLFTVSKNTVKFDFSDLGYKEQSFVMDENAEVTFVDGDKKTKVNLSNVASYATGGKVLQGTLVATPGGAGTSLEFKAVVPEKDE